MLIDYDLLRSERKSIVINIERDGKVLVNAPLDLDEIEIEKYVYKKRFWIWEKLAIKKSATEEMYEKKFISGESFSYLGRNYRLQIVEDNEDLKLKYGWFILGKKNAEFIKKINDKENFFEKMTVLEHPRYIQQYKSKEKQLYIDKYILAFKNLPV